MCLILDPRGRVATVTDNAASRIAAPAPHGYDPLHHAAVGIADRLDTLVAGQAARFSDVLLARLINLAR
jgi:hypothetical protein